MPYFGRKQKKTKMKKIFPFLLLAVCLFPACQDDDDGGPQVDDDVLAYDGENATGPLLAAGYHEAAVKFPASFLQQYEGRRLESILFFIGQIPSGCEVLIYEGTNSDGRPESLIFSSDNVSSGLVAPSWNRLTLDQPITLTDEDIWISIGLTHDQQQQSIGCDSGPNVVNGDWLYDDSDELWLPYTERTPESVNWNIRGELD
jgi:hypothetical protein